MILGPNELADESAEGHTLERLCREINAGLMRQFRPGKKEFVLLVDDDVASEIREKIVKRCLMAGWPQAEWQTVQPVNALRRDVWTNHWKLLLKAK